MVRIKTKLIQTLLCILSVSCFSKANSQSLPEPTIYPGKVDKLFRIMDVRKINGNEFIRNLEARFIDPLASTTDVNYFDSFTLLNNNDYTSSVLTRAIFDPKQQVTNRYRLEGPWVGPGKFTQRDIPAMPLQTGYKFIVNNQCTRNLKNITRLIIYKTINTQQIVYDYVFRDPLLKKGRCQEILFTPDTLTCSQGMIVSCNSIPDDATTLPNLK